MTATGPSRTPEGKPPQEPPREPGGVNGKLVIVVLMTVSLASVVLGFVLIRPPADFEPAPAGKRPFGPAGYGDAENQPLLKKGIAAERKREITGEAPPQPIPIDDDNAGESAADD